MRSTPVYLDYAASAPVRPEAITAVRAALEVGANASSVHAAGRAARATIERAREAVATLAGAPVDGVIFTSGASEANTMAVLSAARAPGVRRLMIGALEHDSVAQAAGATGLPVDVVPVDRHGVYDLDWLRDELARASGRSFVALTAASNETGVVQPVGLAAREVAEHDGWLHVDAVQTAGKMPLEFTALRATTMAISAHKLGGPPGCGALVHTSAAELQPQIFGGGQERGLRAGSENVAGVAGFGAVARLWGAGEPRLEVRAAARRAEHRLREAGAVIAGSERPRLDDFICLAVDAWPSAVQVMALDLEGVQVSAGSACSSGKVRTSRVLESMGFGSRAGGALRATSGWRTEPQDWDHFADVWLQAFARHSLRRRVKEYA